MRQRKFALLVGGLILALVIVGVGIEALIMVRNRAAEHAQRLDSLREAYQACVVVESATEVGVTYVDYGLRLRDAAAVLAVYEPEDDEARKVASHLAAALDTYRVAMNAWATKFAQYEYSAWCEFKRDHPELGLATSMDVEDALHFLWFLAAVRMEAAREGLAAYEHH